MNNEEKALQLLEAQQVEFQKINARLDLLEKYAEVTRDSVNALLKWAEDCGKTVKFPLPKTAAK